jgi:hypothetical protein
MSRLSVARTALGAVCLAATLPSGAARAQESTRIDAAALEAEGCFGQAACEAEGVQLSVSGGTIAKKTLNGATGFGVSGGASGPEIDIGETLFVDAGDPRGVRAIKFLFLFNGPEFGDKAEIARVVADGTAYTLAVANKADDASAAWSGPGTVSKCGATTASGTGCFVVTNPFPAAVGQLAFSAVSGGAPFSGTGTNNSDYSVGYVDLEEPNLIELLDCAGPEGCEVDEGFSFSQMNVTNPAGSTLARAIEVALPDCRYVPRACLDRLPPAGDTPATDSAARQALIDLGVIKSLDPAGPNRLHPATQLLNVARLLPVEVTSLFDTSGVPPEGLPPLWIDPRWKGQRAKDHVIPGYFFRTDDSLQFIGGFDGAIDVSELTGSELGCFADPDDLLAWDVITTGSEIARSVAGRYVDTIINTGCINPTKVKGTRLSIYSILETTPDTYGPTVKSAKPLVTVNNDAVFARLVESLWKDVGEVRASYACRQADPTPAGGPAPLSGAVCRTLAARWSDANKKIRDCVTKSFKPLTGYALGICEYARERVEKFGAALPATPTGPDPYNRLAELAARVETFKHVWDTRFMQSLKLAGFCRERGSCPP